MVALALHSLAPWASDMLPDPMERAYGLRPLRAMTATDDAVAEERSLVEAAQRGDRGALEHILGRVARPLYAAVILPRIGNTAEAEDILRETLARAVERFESFRWTGAGIFPWFRQIAVNLVIDHARRRQRRGRMEERLERHVQDTDPVYHADAEEALIEAQERAIASAALERAMATLNDRYRMAITLRLMEERPREECAAVLGVTVGNFDVILHRALAALRKAYPQR